MPSDDSNNLIIAPCDPSRRQHWFLSDGQIKPEGFREPSGEWTMRRGVCVDASQPDGRLVLHGCHGGPNQKFTGGGLPEMSEDIIQVLGPWEDGQNCIDYDFHEHVAYVYVCHGRANQRWSFTAKDELRVDGDNCLEYDEDGDVAVRPCNGLASRNWRGCTCTTAIDDQINQKFLSDVLRPKSQDLITVDGPWAAGANCVDYNYDTDEAYVYACHASRQPAMGAHGRQPACVRAHGGMCLTLDSGEKAVRMTPCAANDGLQQWRVSRDGHIQPMGYRTAGGAWHALSAKCLSATKSSGVLALTGCDAKAPHQKFRSRAPQQPAGPRVQRQAVSGGRQRRHRDCRMCVRACAGLGVHAQQ
ncbi:hypothetical protein PINS_up021709 [Pythium insidiosum]|nr:hypothetical protein PINS_up021709 [Pythium insidiosum]